MSNSFFLAMLLAALILLSITVLAAERLIAQHHGQKRSFFHQFPIQAGDIVFLGDSLTDGARWDEIYPEYPIKNRGINADTTRGVLERLDEVVAAKPAAIFLLIGTNDLPWYVYRSNEQIISTYRGILKKIREVSPGTQIVVQSLLPRHRRYKNRISVINTGLREAANEYQCEYLDLYPAFSDRDGALRKEFTNDDLHLLGEAYQVWANLLEPILARLAKESPVNNS